MRVLVVDDDRVNGEALAEWLGARGHTAEWAGGGGYGFSRLAAFNPDAVVLDLLMPGVCGKEFIEGVRGSPLWKGLPILVLTAAPDADVDGLPEGVPVLRKPVEPCEVLAALGRLVGKGG